MRKYRIRIIGLSLVVIVLANSILFAPERWTAEQANAWYQNQPWLAGFNFAPRTAINQLEMWQAETFDLPTIDRELGWAEQMGFNIVRVFLHDLLWKQDSKNFIQRIEKFLECTDKHNIKVMFVLMDGVWDPHPQLGTQREPRPHVHNSGWVQSPGVEIVSNPDRHDELKPYVQGVIRRFKADRRVLIWDLFNEPDNLNRTAYNDIEPDNKPELVGMLLRKAFDWAREIEPTQPLTAGVWGGRDWGDPNTIIPIDRLMLEQSDIITFHSYMPLIEVRKRVDNLRRYGRPIICTEYMARLAGSTFNPIMAYMKDQKVGAIHWGFVSGKTQTIYPWDSWTRSYTKEPLIWFHDILRPDGTVFESTEVQYIKALTDKR